MWHSFLIGGLSLGLVLVLGGFLLAWSGTAPAHLGPGQERLAACPDRPNCVSSDAPQSDAHHIAPFHLAVPAERAWQALLATLSEQPRLRIRQQTDGYVHATAHSAFFGFIDDLECQLRPEAGIIAIRSASRVGHSDFGVNRKRVEAIRRQLSAQGMITNQARLPDS